MAKERCAVCGSENIDVVIFGIPEKASEEISCRDCGTDLTKKSKKKNSKRKK